MDLISLHDLLSLLYAFIGGIIPSLFWLYFWDREDRKNPEPTSMILLAFIGGVIAVFVSLYFEKMAYSLDPNIVLVGVLKPILIWLKSFVTAEHSLNQVVLVVIFAPIIEELNKFIMAYLFVLRSKRDDQPIDPMILMITTALGFAAVENALFLIDPITKNHVIMGIISGNMRFIGATLLHTISSATIGIFIGYNLFDKKIFKFNWTVVGIVCAILLHSLFNLLMIGNANNSLLALELIWVLVIILLLIFENIKKRKIERIEDIVQINAINQEMN